MKEDRIPAMVPEQITYSMSPIKVSCSSLGVCINKFNPFAEIEGVVRPRRTVWS